ncbi:MAG: pyridoxamine 5'-phosphate oxidase family protein [Christensenellaceae bacterium]|jgi:nitroimidazol reductase NimA-like FMN-containing flavoprotein (pyridoxamine 5'-phosphate oxidase superfamily)|nr:pyridoxamine 5'-phosphate oxidase family protein [Christensenellaceae bacterium]
MRRSDREITDLARIEEIIRGCDVLRLGLNDGGYPYVVPLNFGFEMLDGLPVFYFHCALEGKKLELIKNDPRAFFELDRAHRLVLSDDAARCTMEYESVMGRGLCAFIEDEAEKLRALRLLLGQYREGAGNMPLRSEAVAVTCAFKLESSQITAKARKVAP